MNTTAPLTAPDRPVEKATSSTRTGTSIEHVIVIDGCAYATDRYKLARTATTLPDGQYPSDALADARKSTRSFIPEIVVSDGEITVSRGPSRPRTTYPLGTSPGAPDMPTVFAAQRRSFDESKQRVVFRVNAKLLAELAAALGDDVVEIAVDDNDYRPLFVRPANAGGDETTAGFLMKVRRG